MAAVWRRLPWFRRLAASSSSVCGLSHPCDFDHNRVTHHVTQRPARVEDVELFEGRSQLRIGVGFLVSASEPKDSMLPRPDPRPPADGRPPRRDRVTAARSHIAHHPPCFSRETFGDRPFPTFTGTWFTGIIGDGIAASARRQNVVRNPTVMPRPARGRTSLRKERWSRASSLVRLVPFR